MVQFVVKVLILFQTILICSSQGNEQYGKANTLIIETVGPMKDEETSGEEYEDVNLRLCPENVDTNIAEAISEDQNHLRDPYSENNLNFGYNNAQKYFNSLYSNEIYGTNSGTDEDGIGYNLINHNNVRYLNPQTQILASYNRIPPVRFLPPVYPRIFAEIPRSRRTNDFDSNIRHQRTSQRNNHHWQQFQPEPIMKNTIPKVPYPYFQDAVIDSVAKNPYYTTDFTSKYKVVSGDGDIPFNLRSLNKENYEQAEIISELCNNQDTNNHDNKF